MSSGPPPPLDRVLPAFVPVYPTVVVADVGHLVAKDGLVAADVLSGTIIPRGVIHFAEFVVARGLGRVFLVGQGRQYHIRDP